MKTMNENTMSYRSSLLVLLLLVTGQQLLANARKLEPRAVNLFRLPARFQPKNYKLKLFLNPDLDTFTGKVDIELDIKEMDSDDSLMSRSTGNVIKPIVKNPKHIILNAEFLKISEASIRQDGHRFYADNIYHDANNKILVIAVNNMDPRRPVTLVINFSGDVQLEPKGLFWNKINADSRTLATHFEPAYARRLFPCFDEPEFKATFYLSIVHPRKFTALSNMGIFKEHHNNDYQTTFFRRTPKMPTYLLSLAVGDFERISESSKYGMEISIYSPIPLSFATDVLKTAKKAYDKVAEYFPGLAPPIVKIDIVAVDMRPMAMENWGLINLHWELLFGSPRRSKPNDWIRTVTVLMVQMIHQRLTNLVTINWWDDLWLKEGLAAHLASELIAELYQDMNIELYALVETTFSVMNDDDQNARSISSRNLKRNAVEYEESFDFFTYKKSAAIMRMIAGFFGKTNVWLAINELVRSYNEHQPVSADKLWEKLSNMKPEHGEMRDLVHQWAMREGYPVIFVELESSRVLRVSQMRGLANDPLWSVPIRYEFHGGPVNEPVRPGEFILSGLGQYSIDLPEWFNIEDENHWFTFNPKYQGYYRVVYKDPSMPAALCKAVKSNRLPAADQMQLISDIYFISKQLRTMKGFWEVLRMLPKETEDGVMLLVTRILIEMHDKKSSLVSVEQLKSIEVSNLMMDYYRMNGRVRKLGGSNLLNLYARGQVVEYLVNIIKDTDVIKEVDDIRGNTEQMPPFLQDVLINLHE